MTRPTDRVRDLVLELWGKTRIDWGFATDRIATAFRRERSLASTERREVAETLYGMIRMHRRVDYALAAAGGKLPPGGGRELATFLAYLLLEGELTADEARAEAARAPGGAALARIDWGAIATIDERIAQERDPVVRLGVARSLPDWLARRLLAEHGAQADALAAALNVRAPLTVRANTLKTTRDALAERLATEGIETRRTRYAPHGLIFETRTNAFGLGAFREGLFEVQDEASQLVAEAVAPPPRGLVVDACAGAGGKTLALGALMGSRGRLVGTDVSERKLEELRKRARRAGLSNARALAIGPDAWPDEIEALVGKADRVLVDSPCSGVGALRRNPEARWRLTEDDLRRLPVEQEAIARRFARLVAPGGRLVYATCTILREENEAVVARLLEKLPDFELMRLAEIWGTERAIEVSADVRGDVLKLLPHVHDTDGFFAAVLRRRS